MSGLIQISRVLIWEWGKYNMRVLYIVFLVLLFNIGYSQRIDRRMDSIPAPIFNFRVSSPDYEVIYNRVRGIRLKVTNKLVDGGNDYRFRVKISDRLRIIYDFIYNDFNPQNFFYSGGITWRF